MEEELIPILGFRRGALIQRTGRGGHLTYWRHLLSDDEFMYVMKVQVGKAPKNSLPYERWELRKHLGLFGTVIQEVEEIVCPKWMLDAKPNAEKKREIAIKWNMIAWAVAEAGDSLITDEKMRANYTKEAAKLAKVKEPRIRSLLTRYFYYGQHKYALMSLDPWKGGPGVERFNSTKLKMGRPNDSVILDSSTKFTGRNMTPYYLGRWQKVLWEEYVTGNKNVSEAYEVLLLRLRGFNRDENGEKVSFPIAPEKLPERSLFLKYGAKLIREFDMKRAKLGELEWGNKYAALRGHSEDLTHRVIDIYDFDGMEFNFEVVHGEIPAGKPNVLLAVDRRSRAIVGWYVWLGKESGYAYKHCLFNAFTSKEERLERFEVPHLTGFVYGVCEQAMFDRGPGISLEVTKAVTGKIRVDSLMTRPRDAKGKGVVENVNGILQKRLASLPGGYVRTNSVRDQDKQRNAAAFAKVEYRIFMQLLLHAISDYNLFTVVSDLLSDEMIKAKVEPNPKAIFLWNRKQRRGDATYDWPASSIYKNLLVRHQRILTKDGVKLAKAEYSSEEIKRYYENWNSGPSKKRKGPQVILYSFAETNQVLVWERPDGSIAILNMKVRHENKYKDSPSWLHQLINRQTNAQERAQRLRQAKGATLALAKEEVIRAVDGLPKKRVLKGVKSENRNKANSEIVGEEFDENLSLLTNRTKLSAKDNEITAGGGLIGYRKPSPSNTTEDVDW